LAIYEGNLIVRIEDKEINKDNIGDRIEFSKSQSKEFSRVYQLFLALVSPDTPPIKLSILEDNDAVLYIKSESDFDKTIANFRSTGMLIYMTWKNILQRYAAVFVARGMELNKILREAEPQRHNRWDAHIIDKAEKEKRKLAKSAIERINAEILHHLKNQYERPTGDKFDSGEGDYLPDADYDDKSSFSGEDILRPKTTVSAVHIKHEPERKTSFLAEHSKGVEQEGEDKGGKPTSNPAPTPPPPRRKPVVPQPEQADEQEGVKVGDGSHTISRIDLSTERVFPLVPDLGLYKAIICTERDCPKTYLSFAAVGEDANREQLIVLKYVVDGQTDDKETNEIGPIELKKNVHKEIIIHFKNKEKMLLNLRAREAE
jgi:hypothetical protein